MTKLFYNAKDISQIMQISDSKAYKIIATLNKELEGSGFITVHGKVNRIYFQQRFNIPDSER
ncbi:MAG: transcriptional regulator [Ruminococcus sp.]|nr:transcriptional regulator [Ruminococcus sp.]